MVTLSKIIEGLEMVDDIVDCYYNLHKDEVFLSNIGEYGDLSEDEIWNSRKSFTFYLIEY